MIIFIILLILAVLFTKNIKAIFSFLFVIVFLGVLWQMAWWGKIIDILIGIILICSVVVMIREDIKKENAKKNASKETSNNVKRKRNKDVDLSRVRITSVPPDMRDIAEKFNQTQQAKQLQQFELEQVKNIVRILDECATIISKSKNLDTVISRLKVGEQNALQLQKFEKQRDYIGQYSSDLYLDLFINDKAKLINECIQRSYDDLLLKVNGLVTRKAKMDNLDKFIKQINVFKDEYADINIAFIENIEGEIQKIKSDIQNEMNNEGKKEAQNNERTIAKSNS